MSVIHSLFGGLISDSSSSTSLYPLQTKDSSGTPVDLGQYAGKVVLIVNTASKCGFTKQYDALEALHKKYCDAGLVVLGFPSNDFMGQEPGSDSEIESFCRINHGVSFRLFPKAPVRGAGKQSEVGWNFEKFLVDKNGRVIGRFKPSVRPDSSELRDAIEQALK